MSQDEGYNDSLFNPSDDRSNFKNVIAKRSDLVRWAGGRAAPSQANTVLQAGTVLGYATTGADAGYYKPYNSANTDGSQTAAGVLGEEADVGSIEAGGGPAPDGGELRIIKEGELLQAFLIGLDAGAITAMSGTSYVEHGTTILSIRA